MDTKINKLEEIGKDKNPFKIPENYFAQFNEDMMARLPEKEIVAPQPVSLWDKVKPWVYLAAMFVGLYVTINFLMKAPGNENPDGMQVATQQTLSDSHTNTDVYWSKAQITEEEFYHYLEEQLIDDSYFEYMYHQYYLN